MDRLLRPIAFRRGFPNLNFRKSSMEMDLVTEMVTDLVRDHGLGLVCVWEDFCATVFESATRGSLVFNPSCDPNGCGPYTNVKVLFPTCTTEFAERTWFMLAEYPCVFRCAVTMTASLTSTVELQRDCFLGLCFIRTISLVSRYPNIGIMGFALSKHQEGL